MAGQTLGEASRNVPIKIFETKNLASIDSIRGYAILLVILCHSVVHVPNLPWPIKRIAALGIYGVQLFFIASALTLVVSWNRDKSPFLAKVRSFYIARVFRIVPLYYAAIPFYYFIYNNLNGFDTSTLLATTFFYNSWSPDFLFPFNSWAPVPGGWSISVEMSFYLIFPILMLLIKNVLKASIFLVFTMWIAATLPYFMKVLLGNYPGEQLSLFLYYFPLNQFPIFGLGLLAYNVIVSPKFPWLIRKKIIPIGMSIFVVAIFFMLSRFPQARTFNFSPMEFPTHLLIGFVLTAWVMAVISFPISAVVNSAVMRIGRVSFSVYVLHFSVLELLDHLSHYGALRELSGYGAVFYFFSLFALATLLTYLFSIITYSLIEIPFIRLGQRVNVWLADDGMIRRICFARSGHK